MTSACRRAFTLIAVFVVIAIIAILAAVSFPCSRRRESGHARSAALNVRQLAVGVLLYAQDWDETLPMGTNYGALETDSGGSVLNTLAPYLRWRRFLVPECSHQGLRRGLGHPGAKLHRL